MMNKPNPTTFPSAFRLPPIRLVLAALAAWGLGGAPALAGDVDAGPGVSFVDSGIALGLTESANTIGVSWADWDMDGDPDLLSQGFNATGRWHRNDLSEPDGGFVDVTEALGVGLDPEIHKSGWSTAWGDFDEDGDPDVYLGNEGENVLWRNLGDGTFENATLELGLKEGRFSQAPCWVDFDMDGDLDLHLTMEFDPFRMLRQKEDGTFEDVSVETGLNDAQSHSYGLSWADFDGDGDLDCAVSTCGSSQIDGTLTVDRLWRSNMADTGSILFDEIGELAGVNFQGNMYGNEFADPDGDGDFDLFVASTSSSTPNRFYVYNGALPFEEMAEAMGVSGPGGAGRGLEWIDYDNDGDLDLYVQVSSQPGRLYHNFLAEEGAMRFEDRAAALGLTQTFGGFDGAWADADNDGDLDLAVASSRENRFYFNEGGNANNWLFVKLEGDTDTLSGVGATIRLRIGENWQTRVHGGQPGSFSQNYLPTHFGLGQAAAADEIVVKWLTGEETVLQGPIDANQTLLIQQAQVSANEGFSGMAAY